MRSREPADSQLRWSSFAGPAQTCIGARCLCKRCRPLPARRCDPVALIRAHPILRRHGCSDPGDPDVAEALARREWAEGSERSSRVRSQNGSLKRGQHDMPGGFLGMATSPLPDGRLQLSRYRLFLPPTGAYLRLGPNRRNGASLHNIGANCRKPKAICLARLDAPGRSRLFSPRRGVLYLASWTGLTEARRRPFVSPRLGVPAARGRMSFRARRSTATQRGATHSSGHGVMPTLQVRTGRLAAHWSKTYVAQVGFISRGNTIWFFLVLAIGGQWVRTGVCSSLGLDDSGVIAAEPAAGVQMIGAGVRRVA